jgi:hypothetical protein
MHSILALFILKNLIPLNVKSGLRLIIVKSVLFSLMTRVSELNEASIITSEASDLILRTY